jgi:hypothetical protein
MAKVNRIEKKAVMPKWDLIKFQIFTHCYLNRITMSESELNCLTMLSLNQPVDLNEFCFDLSEEASWIYKSPQSARNAINKCKKKKLVIKNPDDKRQVLINPNIKLCTEGNILYELKFLAKDDSQEIS